MLKTEQFNNVPAELLEKFKLGPSDVAVFKCLHNSVGEGGRPIYPTYSIAPIATIMTDSGPVEIANVVEQAPAGKRPKIEDCIFEGSQKGTIVCRGSVARDVRKYTFLMLHPENEANGGSTFRLEAPGERKKAEFEKAQLEARAVLHASETPLDVLIGQLKERGVDVAGKKEYDIREIAAEEGKRKLFEKPASAFSAEEINALIEMAEVGVIIWDQSVKKLKNINTEKYYEVPGVKSTGPIVPKVKSLIDIAASMPDVVSIMKNDVLAYNGH